MITIISFYSITSEWFQLSAQTCPSAFPLIEHFWSMKIMSVVDFVVPDRFWSPKSFFSTQFLSPEHIGSMRIVYSIDFVFSRWSGCRNRFIVLYFLLKNIFHRWKLTFQSSFSLQNDFRHWSWFFEVSFSLLDTFDHSKSSSHSYFCFNTILIFEAVAFDSFSFSQTYSTDEHDFAGRFSRFKMIPVIANGVFGSIFLLWRFSIREKDHFVRSFRSRVKLIIQIDPSDSISSSQTSSNDEKDHFHQLSHLCNDVHDRSILTELRLSSRISAIDRTHDLDQYFFFRMILVFENHSIDSTSLSETFWIDQSDHPDQFSVHQIFPIVVID